jgi:hypothetical protein
VNVPCEGQFPHSLASGVAKHALRVVKEA